MFQALKRVRGLGAAAVDRHAEQILSPQAGTRPGSLLWL